MAEEDWGSRFRVSLHAEAPGVVLSELAGEALAPRAMAGVLEVSGEPEGGAAAFSVHGTEVAAAASAAAESEAGERQSGAAPSVTCPEAPTAAGTSWLMICARSSSGSELSLPIRVLTLACSWGAGGGETGLGGRLESRGLG